MKIPLVEFQRNALRTSLKDQTPNDLEEYSESAIRNLIIKQFPDEIHYLEDAWEFTEIETNKFFIAHTDFRQYPIPKNGNFAEEFVNWRPLIDSGEFKCAANIQDGMSVNYPPLIVSEREAGKYYVLDGQCRIITLLYHNVQLAKVHLYTGQERV